VANEVDPEIIFHQKATIVGLTPQGWHRGWDSKGNVSYIPWPRAKDILPKASAVILSREDISDEETWQLYKKYCKILVITYGSEGCLVRYRKKEKHFSAPEYEEIDPTGVGDIFAAAFFIKLLETDGDPFEAARFATRVASPTVTRRGLEGIPSHREVKTLLNISAANVS
jgi:sugar/nucleoside kinase (ribokinase family)